MTEEEELKLPPKFISVHPLAAKKGSHYSCVICGSDAAYMCKLCRSCYCCREHLLLDDLACHAILCERQAAILEILSLPLATQARPETAARLYALRDECRRVAYLESRRHVLDCHHELALPAAERSLHFAREVHGPNSVDLVPPLLALADVATVAGAKEAVGYVSRAAFLLQEEVQRIRAQIRGDLSRTVSKNLENLRALNPEIIVDQLEDERRRKAALAGWSPARQSGPGAPAGPETLTKTPIEQLQEFELEDALRDEVYRSRGGANLGYMTSKFWSSSTKVLVFQEDYGEALRAAAKALYFATLSCGVQSLQTALCLYQLVQLGQLSGRFTVAQRVDGLGRAQDIFRTSLLTYYAPLVIQVAQLVEDRKLQFAYDAPALRDLVADYNQAEAMREEDRLSFRADVKEATKRAMESVPVLEAQFGADSPQYAECAVVIGVALQCICDQDADKWDGNARAACARLEAAGGTGRMLAHVYRLLYGW